MKKIFIILLVLFLCLNLFSITKIKIFSFYSDEKNAEIKINDFIKDKKIKDIKIAGASSGFYIIIIYEE